jgi:hypothetical protein
MLPLTTESYESGKARPFFAGILPEEAPRARITRILGISERNDFAMLERIGGECAGAISVLLKGCSRRKSRFSFVLWKEPNWRKSSMTLGREFPTLLCIMTGLSCRKITCNKKR